MADTLKYLRQDEFQEDIVAALTQAFKDTPDQLEQVTGLTTGRHAWKTSLNTGWSRK